MERKPKDLNYDEKMLESLGATPFTANKYIDDGEEVYAWTTVSRFFPEKMRDHKTLMTYFLGNLRRIGIDEPISPDQPEGGEVCHELTYEEVLHDYKTKEAREDGSQWLVEKNYDAVFLTRQTHFEVMQDMGRSLSLTFSAADCAIIRMYDKEKDVIGITHSDLVHTSKNIIGSMVDYMIEHFGSDPKNIMAFVGAFAKEGMIWDRVPPCQEKNPEVWEGYIKQLDDSHYEILYGDKIYDQLTERGLSKDNIYFDSDNTITNKDYYSHNRSILKGEKEGRNLFGITFDGLPVYENVEKKKTRTRLK